MKLKVEDNVKKREKNIIINFLPSMLSENDDYFPLKQNTRRNYKSCWNIKKEVLKLQKVKNPRMLHAKVSNFFLMKWAKNFFFCKSYK